MRHAQVCRTSSDLKSSLHEPSWKVAGLCADSQPDRAGVCIDPVERRPESTFVRDLSTKVATQSISAAKKTPKMAKERHALRAVNATVTTWPASSTGTLMALPPLAVSLRT